MHGWGGNKDSLASLAAPFSREYRVTLVDLYGFGETPHPDKKLRLSDYADSVAELIRRYKMSSVVLVGHSFGGKVALCLARRYGALIDKMVLIDASGIRPKRSLKFHIRVILYKIRKKLGLVTPSDEHGSKDYRAAKGRLRDTFVSVVNTHLDRDLHYITLPVLLIWGAEDKETPLYMAKKLKRRLAHAILFVIENAGHFPYADQYAECLALIKKFVGGSL